MTINEPDTSALHAILRNEKRRTAVRNLENAAFIDVHTVLHLRREIFRDGVVDRNAADALFAVERRDVPACAEWRDFFIESIVDHLLWQVRPSGVLNGEKAEWLLAQADRTQTLSAFAILVAVLEDAHSVPAWFAAAVRGRAQKGWPGLEEAALAAA